MHKLIDYVCQELEELEEKASKKGQLSMAELQQADTLAHLKKNLLKSEEMSGYSNRDGYSREPNYSMERDYVRPDGSYSRDYSMKRDSMGRYSRSDDIRHELHELMNKAGDEQTRREIKKLMDRM